MTRLWVYKNNARNDSHQSSYGNWMDFFAKSQGLPGRLGNGAQVSRISREAIFAMNPGDSVLCWQSDKRSALGLTVVSEMSDYVDAQGRMEREIYLKTYREFAEPVKLLEIRKRDPRLACVRAFKQGNVRTIYPTSTAEAEAILAACGQTWPTAVEISKAKRANKLSEVAAISTLPILTRLMDGTSFRSRRRTLATTLSLHVDGRNSTLR